MSVADDTSIDLQVRIGQLIDRYVVEEYIGQGGMSRVYRVSHLHLRSAHALKIVTILIPEIRQRVLNEGRSQAGLSHPNVLAVTDAILYQGLPCLVMEFVEGPTLWELMQDFHPTTEEALELFRGVLRGVDAAHRHGLVHRDLKPDNILLAGDESGVTPKVCDFGLVKNLQSRDSARMTDDDGVLGTPGYMSPEQITSPSTVDHRTDLFSLGCILYEMCTGKQVFPGDNSFDIQTRIVEGRYIPPSNIDASLPDDVVEVINCLLRPDPNDRYPNTEALMIALYGSVEAVRDNRDSTQDDESASAMRPETQRWVAARSTATHPGGRSRPSDNGEASWPLGGIVPTLNPDVMSAAEERFWTALIAFLCGLLGVVCGLLIAQRLGLF